MSDLADADRKAVQERIDAGQTMEAATEEFLTEEYFAAHPDIQNKKKQDKLRAIVANADEEDNPILVLLKLRK